MSRRRARGRAPDPHRCVVRAQELLGLLDQCPVELLSDTARRGVALPDADEERLDVAVVGVLGEAEKHIARYKFPKAFVFVPQIVRSPAGKADYRWAKQTAVDAAAG